MTLGAGTLQIVPGGRSLDRGISAGRSPLRIVIASHSHPEVSNGGAEIAAFQLFCRLQERADCEAWFVGCKRSTAGDRPGPAMSQPFSEREFLYAASEFDWFKFANRDRRYPSDIERLFTRLAPDVVHFHHYTHLGLETFLYVKRVLPQCKIFLTLHEYLAICHHFGQMITKPHLNLCYQSSPAECQKCFPEFATSDFFLRKRYIMRFFDLVDCFIAPSRFLATRYIAWGVPEPKMIVIENVVPAGPAADRAGRDSPDELFRIGFFGQISALKGIDVLFDAAAILNEQGHNDVIFEIFGDYRGQPPVLQQKFLDRLGKVGHNVRFLGPYGRKQLDRLMTSVDAVVVPSIWWENSPLVIQEALRNRRPVICSDIGGMAEKVRDGIDGFHFPVGSAVDLAMLLKRLAKNRDMLSNLGKKLRLPPSPEALIEAHLQLYRKIHD